MSLQMGKMIKDLQVETRELRERLDNVSKAVNTLKRSVSHMERNPASKSGVRVPQTPLPDTLDKLEIGKQPQGT